MYICVCNAMTDADIKQAVEEGANSMSHLESKLGVSNQCGTCACDAKRCLTEALEEQFNDLDLITY